MQKLLEEFGKLFLNMALASFVFVILQPFVANDLNINKNAFIGLFLWIVFSSMGGYMLYVSAKTGGKKDE